MSFKERLMGLSKNISTVIKPTVIKNPTKSALNISLLSIKLTLFRTEKRMVPTSKLPNSFIEPTLADTIFGAQSEEIKAHTTIKRHKIINGRSKKLIFRFWILNIISPTRLAKIAKRVMPLGATNPIMGKMKAMLAKKWPAVFERFKIFIINRLFTISL